MIVMKFGGTSVGGAKEIRQTCEIIKSQLDRKPIVVVSAVSGITDLLLGQVKLAANGNFNISRIREQHQNIFEELQIENSEINALLRELVEKLTDCKPTNEKLDEIASFGERISARIVSSYLNNLGINSKAVDSYDIGIVTDDNFLNAQILPETYDNVKQKFMFDVIVPVVTGFIAKNREGKITTLGRGGSDYTASIIGAALSADEIQIWTDVDGIKSADPKIIPHAETIDIMSFAEASELAYFGAKVLHPKTIIPAMDKNIPVKVLNTLVPGNPGTTIVPKRTNIVSGRVRGVTSKKDIKIITVNSTRMLGAAGFLEKLFSTFASNNIEVDMVSTSEVSVSATVNNQADTGNLVADIEKYANVAIEHDRAIICVVGEGLDSAKGLAGKVFSCMGKNGVNINMISQGASEINVSFVVEEKQADKAVRHLHDEFFRVNKNG